MKIIKWILVALTLLSTIIMLFVLPDTVPVHFDINGMADRWGSKFELLILPVVLIACAFSMEPLKNSYINKSKNTNDEKEKAEHLTNAKVLNITSVITMFLFTIMNFITLYNTYIIVYPDSTLPQFDIMRVVGVVMGIVIVLLGNYMPKTRLNSNIGFRLPWTMYNDNTWNKSNRFASYVFMIVGAILAISSLLFESGAIVGMVAFLIGMVITVLYAYLVYSRERRKDNEGNHKE